MRAPLSIARVALGAALLAAVPWSPAAARQEPAAARAASLQGTVAGRAGTPLPRATVSAAGRQTTTDDRGRFVLQDIPPGATTVRVTALGYRPLTRDVTVPVSGAVELSLVLEPAAVFLNEVRVLASRSARERFDESAEVGAISLGGAAMRTIPALGESDVLRAVQLMPGVLGRHDYTAGYNVRGGEADQNLVLLDGIPVYNPFHLGGLFGTFAEPTVGDVTLLSGGFPATYGGRLSSVLEVTTAEEARPGVHGDVSVSLLATTVALGGSLPAQRTTWNVAVRRTYADQVVQAVADDAFPYHFRDEQLHVAHELPGGGRVALTAYDGRDVLQEQLFRDDEFESDEDTTFSNGRYEYDWGNSVAGLAWQQPLGARWALTQRLSYSRFSSTLDIGEGSRILSNAVNDARLGGSLAAQLGAHRLTVGYDLARLKVDYHDRSPRTTITHQSLRQEPVHAAAYLDDVWQLGSRLILRPGVRVEAVGGGADWSGVSPRAAVKFFATPDLAITLAGGLATQPVHSLRREDVPADLFDYWLAADEHVPVSTATHVVLGAERWWGASRFARVEAFDKEYGDLVEPNPADDKIVRGDEFLPVDGRAYGVDVLVRQLESHAVSGWLSYSYGVATRQRGDTSYWATQDRRHNLNAVAAWRTARGWILGARLGVGSGTPYTPIVAQAWQVDYDPLTGRYGSGTDRGDLLAVGGPRNGSRLPLYHRLDLGVSRRIVKRTHVLVPSLQLVNVYNRQNVFRYAYDYSGTPPTRKAVTQLPIVPTVGLSVEF
jgi:hypothetical protein